MPAVLGKLQFYFPSSYGKELRTIPFHSTYPGKILVREVELWWAKGSSTAPDLEGLRLWIASLGATNDQGKEIVDNDFVKVGATSTGPFYAFDSANKYEIGTLTANGSTSLFFQMNVTGSSIETIGQWVAKLTVDQDGTQKRYMDLFEEPFGNAGYLFQYGTEVLEPGDTRYFATVFVSGYGVATNPAALLATGASL